MGHGACWRQSAWLKHCSLFPRWSYQGAASVRLFRLQTGTSRPDASAHVHTIPRSREVGQSYLTSVMTTLIAMLASAQLVYRLRPDLVRISTSCATAQLSLVMQSVLSEQLHVQPKTDCLVPQVLVNGPGTCIPLCAAAFIWRFAQQQARCNACGSYCMIVCVSIVVQATQADLAHTPFTG